MFIEDIINAHARRTYVLCMPEREPVLERKVFVIASKSLLVRHVETRGGSFRSQRK